MREHARRYAEVGTRPRRSASWTLFDPAVARTVLAGGLRPWIVPSDVTFDPANEMTAGAVEDEIPSAPGGGG